MGVAVSLQVKLRPGRWEESKPSHLAGLRVVTSLLYVASVVLAQLHPNTDELLFTSGDGNMKLMAHTWTDVCWFWSSHVQHRGLA